MIREKPPQTPHLRRIFVFEHELIIKSRDIPRVCPQSTPPHTPYLRRIIFLSMNCNELKTMLLASGLNK